MINLVGQYPYLFLQQEGQKDPPPQKPKDDYPPAIVDGTRLVIGAQSIDNSTGQDITVEGQEPPTAEEVFLLRQVAEKEAAMEAARTALLNAARGQTASSSNPATFAQANPAKFPEHRETIILVVAVVLLALGVFRFVH
jgi:hypothetical protein